MSDQKEKPLPKKGREGPAPMERREFGRSGNEYITPPFRDRLLLGLHFTLPFLLILAILGVGVFTGYALLKRDGNGLRQDSGTSFSGALPLSIEAFASAYVQARGGLTNLESLSSIQFSGDLYVDGDTFDFVLIKQVPDRALLTVFFGTHQLTVGINGDQVWRRIELNDGNAEVSLLSEAEQANYSDMRQFYDPLSSFVFSRQGTILSLEKDRYEGRDYLRVELERAPGQAPSTFYVDPDTMCTAVMLEKLPDGSERRTRFADYREVRGLPVPFSTKVWLGDHLKTAVYIQKARANVGIMSSVFDLPVQLAE